MDAVVNMVSGGKNLSSPFSRPKKKACHPLQGVAGRRKGRSGDGDPVACG